MIVIVGSGLSGLACARTLVEAGAEAVQLIERRRSVGGRVSTLTAGAAEAAGESNRGGYAVDRGFQVLLSSYPTVRRLLDFDALDMRWFDSGALLATEGKGPQAWYAPNRHPVRGLASLLSAGLPLSDQLRLGRMMAGWAVTSENRLMERLDDRDTELMFNQTKFSTKFLDRFLRPFFGGVLLDDKLRTSAALTALYGKSFALGRAGIPRRGMEEIPRQLASRLPAGIIHEGCEVVSLGQSGEGCELGMADGSRIEADKVVLATDPWSAARLLGREAPAARATTAVYLASDEPFYREKLLMLFPYQKSEIVHVAQISNLSSSVSPPGRHLLCATLLGDADGHSDDQIVDRVKADLGRFFPRMPGNVDCVAVVRVPRALPVQLPGWRVERQRWRDACPAGVVLAGDLAASASIEGALSSGVAAAHQVIRE